MEDPAIKKYFRDFLRQSLIIPCMDLNTWLAFHEFGGYDKGLPWYYGFTQNFTYCFANGDSSGVDTAWGCSSIFPGTGSFGERRRAFLKAQFWKCIPAEMGGCIVRTCPTTSGDCEAECAKGCIQYQRAGVPGPKVCVEYGYEDQCVAFDPDYSCIEYENVKRCTKYGEGGCAGPQCQQTCLKPTITANSQMTAQLQSECIADCKAFAKNSACFCSFFNPFFMPTHEVCDETGACHDEQSSYNLEKENSLILDLATDMDNWLDLYEPFFIEFYQNNTLPPAGTNPAKQFQPQIIEAVRAHLYQTPLS